MGFRNCCWPVSNSYKCDVQCYCKKSIKLFNK